MNRTLPLLSLLFLCCGASLAAQPLSEWVAAADAAFAKEDYYSAYRYYDVAVKYDTARMDLWYRLGESAQEFTAYSAAQRAYVRVGTSSQRDSFPLLTFKLAQVLQKKGNYTEAAALYQEFVSSDPEGVDEDILQEAENQRRNSEWAINVVADAAETIVRHYPGDVNSTNNDFAPSFRNDTLFFSSLRYYNKKDSIMPKRSLARIFYRIEKEKGKARKDEENEKERIIELAKAINQPGRMAAHSAFNEQGDKVYFTLCDYLGGSAAFRCEIYAAGVAADGEWGTPARLPLNDAEATNTQPNVGQDPATGKPYLYFSSDRAGGRGGMDIYRAELRSDGTCGPVEAVNAVNTEGNDVTPFYYAPTRVLYFSTDGRYTLGGFDIYRANWNGAGWDEPENMVLPVNSSYNDLYYSRFADRQEAYFASNRPDSAAVFWDKDKEACCNDIYSVGITDEIKLLAKTFHAIDLTELAGTSVALYELTPDGGRRLVDSLHNPTANDFEFVAIPGKKYELVARKPGFSVDRDTVDLTDPVLMREKEIERKLYLSPEIKLDVFTFNKLDSTELIGTTAYLYEYTPEGDLILVDSIVNPTGNDHHFTLQRGKQYTVIANKEGYKHDQAYIDTDDPKFAETQTIRRDLYLEPGLILDVYTFRLLDKKPLTGATVYLYEYSDEEGEVLVDSTTNWRGHLFGFLVEKGKRYVIRGTRSGYGEDTTTLDLSGPDVPETGKTYRRDLYLGQLLEVFVFDKITKEPLPGADIRIIDIETGEVIAEKINPDGHDFRFSINLDKPYRIEVKRKGYKDYEELLTFTREDLEAGGGKITHNVYMEPFPDPDSMLPLFLYFDNDHPDPRSTSPTTDAEYVKTNVAYFEKKQQFVSTFTLDMELEEAYRTRRRFNDFFNLEVRGGRYDLEEFSKRLLRWLEAGNSYVIDLRGFASPRASDRYNQILSSRRIKSVQNFFEGYENGALQTYLDRGILKYDVRPLGETQADPRVIDKLDDPKNSIFNLFASLERRVEVRSATSREKEKEKEND